MPQTIRSIVLELQPESVLQLRAQIARMKQQQETLIQAYSAIKLALPVLHFMSVTIFPDDQYDPVLVIEVNFDGPAGPFWAMFEAAFSTDLRDMLRCGKPLRDNRAALFESVTAAGSRAPIAPLIEALAVVPAVGHQGNRGLDRSRIDAEGVLFADIQTALDHSDVAVGATQTELHARLRTRFATSPCLATPAAPRISTPESVEDYLRLGIFLVLLLTGLCLPGIIVSLVCPALTTLVVLLVLTLVLAVPLVRQTRGTAPATSVVPGQASTVKLSPKLVAAVLGVVLVLALFVTVLAAVWAYPASLYHWRSAHFGRYFWPDLVHVALGLLGVVPTLVGVVAAIRGLECRDAPQDAPRLDPATMQAMARREDMITQNHMGSVVHIKPGVLRAIVVRVALRALGLVLRILARDGFLGSMRTIHFAHWAIISNGARLMFFSNFDGSWESYLDDFIEKAHVGLTLAWTSGIGFPATRFLILDGATQGRQFKAWARHSMAESLFWYSAYVSFTVNQIERQARVADGLRRPYLSTAEAEQWALDL